MGNETEDGEAKVQQAFIDISYNENVESLTLVTFDHNIMMCNVEDLKVKKQVSF